MAKISVIDSTISLENDVDSNNSKKHITFRRCLLTICQQEFEMDKEQNDILQKMYQEHEDCADVYQKQILQEELELKEKEVHKHSLGNVRL
ncbi:hypothetical protein, partial [Salmonella sp. s51228]|uniref:hypothetical protein n=1 Tax=Salmonella sp. s51228 TaxID=3159652 RepID=UPI00397EAAEB